MLFRSPFSVYAIEDLSSKYFSMEYPHSTLFSYVLLWSPVVAICCYIYIIRIFVKASAFNLSRKKSMDIIKSENVKVNFEIIEKPSKEIEEGDMISVRGLGRFILYEIKGRSKSNRFICVIRIIL